MELDDLKLAWQSLDRQMDRRYALDLALFKERRVDRVRARLRPLHIGQWVQLLAGIVMTLLFASFWVQHRATPHLLVSGLLLHAYAVLWIVCAARELHLLHGIDHAAPVLAIQRRLGQLRAWRLRIARWFGVTGCLIWIPLVLVVFKAAFGADIVRDAPQVAVAFVAAGALCLAALLGFMRWVRRPRRARLARAVDDSAVGRSVNRAQAELDEIARFEQE